jgi:simple sugar transport system permease protein
MSLPYHLRIQKRTEEVRAGCLWRLQSGDCPGVPHQRVDFAADWREPIKTFGYFFNAAFGSWGALSDVVVKATPLLLIGLGCGLAFRMRLWNIGAEGQFYIGAFFASLVPLVPLVDMETTPKFVILLMMALLGMLGGGLYGFIPGWLKAKFNVSEIISTLMLNYVAVFFNNYWIYSEFSDAGFQMTPMFAKSAWLPRLADYAREVKAFSGITLHLGVVFGLIAAFIIWIIMTRSRWGYEINLIGDNPQAARYAGINITRNVFLVFMLSGALAGLAGMSEVSGVVHRLQERISTNYGFFRRDCSLACEAKSFCHHPGFLPVRSVDCCRPGNPAFRSVLFYPGTICSW